MLDLDMDVLAAELVALPGDPAAVFEMAARELAWSLINRGVSAEAALEEVRCLRVSFVRAYEQASGKRHVALTDVLVGDAKTQSKAA